MTVCQRGCRGPCPDWAPCSYFWPRGKVGAFGCFLQFEDRPGWGRGDVYGPTTGHHGA